MNRELQALKTCFSTHSLLISAGILGISSCSTGGFGQYIQTIYLCRKTGIVDEKFGIVDHWIKGPALCTLLSAVLADVGLILV